MSAKRARNSRNLIDENQILSNANINQTNGTIISSTATNVTDFIEVKKGFYYTIKAATKGEVVSSNVRPIGLYDSNNAYVGNQAFLRITPQQMIDGTTFVIPDTLEKEVYKIRIAIDKAMTNIMLNEGSSPLPYEPYGTIWEPCAVKQYHVSKTIESTGALPITINADGNALLDYRIYGASGGVGDKTENLWNNDDFWDNGHRFLKNEILFGYAYTVSPGNYTISTNVIDNVDTSIASVFAVAASPDQDPAITSSGNGVFVNRPRTVTVSENQALWIIIRVAIINTQKYLIWNKETFSHYWIMLNLGSTAPVSYVPYGYEVDMPIGSNILQSSEIEQGGWNAASGKTPQKIVYSQRCRSKNIYPISGKKIFYDYKSFNVNIAFIDSAGLSLGSSGFKSGVGSVDVPVNAVKCLFIIANTDTSANITPKQVIAAGIWTSVDATTTLIYIGSDPLGEGEYVDYDEQKVYRMINGVLTPTDPPIALPALPTCDGTTIIDYAGTPKPSQMYIKYNSGSGWEDCPESVRRNGTWVQQA